MDIDDLKKITEKINNPQIDQIKKLQKSLSPAIKKMQESVSLSLSNFYPQEPIAMNIPINPNLASEFSNRLKKWIEEFDNSLDQQFEVGVRLVNFGQTVTFHLENIGYWNPSLISFSGFTEKGDPVKLIQHVSQISILLMRMKRKNPEKPKRPIGFKAIEDAE